MPEPPTIVPVADVHTAILGAPPLSMRTDEIEWTRRAALSDVRYHRLSKVQQKVMLEGILTYGTAVRYHAKLTKESGEPAGSGVCVTSGGRRGILTARHVLFADDEGKKRLPDPIISFMPPQRDMLRELRRHDRLTDRQGPLGIFPMIGISIGTREIIVPLQRPGKSCPDPGLPDIAIIAISNDIEERLRKAAADEGTTTPEPEWLDLDAAEKVGIPYSMTTNDADEMLEGDWVVIGVRGERSSIGKILSESNIGIVDRIYRRSEYEYYGIFLDEVNGSRAKSKGWKGTSGGGVWQQRFTQAGRQKLQSIAPSPLTPEDLEPPVLGGIAFFHETRKSPQELRDADGRRYRSELYAHRIDEMLLGIIRRALRHEIKQDS